MNVIEQISYFNELQSLIKGQNKVKRYLLTLGWATPNQNPVPFLLIGKGFAKSVPSISPLPIPFRIEREREQEMNEGQFPGATRPPPFFLLPIPTESFTISKPENMLIDEFWEGQKNWGPKNYQMLGRVAKFRCQTDLTSFLRSAERLLPDGAFRNFEGLQIRGSPFWNGTNNGFWGSKIVKCFVGLRTLAAWRISTSLLV